MNNYYAPPKAELLDDAKSKGRFAHAFCAAGSGFVAVLILLMFITYLKTGDLKLLQFLRSLLISGICSFVVGLSVVRFHKISIIRALLIGAFLGPVITISMAIIVRFLMF